MASTMETAPRTPGSPCCFAFRKTSTFYGSVGDAARPYPKRIQTVLEQAQRFQEDVFHTRLDLGILRRKLENSAYRAFAAEYLACRQWEKLTRSRRAHASGSDRVAAPPSRSSAAGWPMPPRRSTCAAANRETNLWLLNEAIAPMSTLDHPEVVKMAKRLKDHQDRLLT